jgi:hypothetical protein
VRSTRKIVLGVGALVVIALIGLVFGIQAISNSGRPDPTETTQAGNAPVGTGEQNAGGETESPTPQKIALTADMVRIVDPLPGEGADTGEAAYTVDDDEKTVWRTEGFFQPKFGNNKAGMGVLINLGKPRKVSDVLVETSEPGVAMEIRTGTRDLGDSRANDVKLIKEYKKLGDGDTVKTDGTTKLFPVFDENQTYQYILVFLTELPRDSNDGRYRVEVSKIQVNGI